MARNRDLCLAKLFLGVTYEEEVIYLKDWVGARMAWIDGNIEESGNNGDLESGSDIVVYPSPASNALNLSIYLSSAVQLDVEMFDLTGRKVLVDVFNPGNTGYQYAIFDISWLSPGYYVLRISQGGRLISR